MVKLPNLLVIMKSLFRKFSSNYTELPEKSKSEFIEIANDPKGWGLAIEKAWDSSKIECYFSTVSYASVLLKDFMYCF